MGLAASQSRFLSLQNRKTRIGFDLISLAGRKQALAREMKIISNNYGEALTQTRLKFSIDSGQTTYNLNYDLLMKPSTLNCESPFILTDKQGRVVVDDNKLEFEGTTLSLSYLDIAKLISTFSEINQMGALQFGNTGNVDSSGESGGPAQLAIGWNENPDGSYTSYVIKENYVNNEDPAEVSLRNYICSQLGIIDSSMTEYTKSKIMDFYDAIIQMISKNGWVFDDRVNDATKHEESEEYLHTMLKNSQYFLTEAKVMDNHAHYSYVTKQSANINKIYEVQDDDAVTKAYGDYSAKRTEISTKEKKYDQMMKMLETEQEAIETELQSLERVRDENVDNFFKIFA